MRHPLFQKRALDAVNEALLEPMTDPRAEKDWVSPYGGRGTEIESLERRTARLRDLCQKSASLLTKAAGDDPVMQAYVRKHVADLRKELKTADVKMHEDPRILPPRNDLRSHLDEDIKEETRESMKEASRKSVLFNKRVTGPSY